MKITVVKGQNANDTFRSQHDGYHLHSMNVNLCLSSPYVKYKLKGLRLHEIQDFIFNYFYQSNLYIILAKHTS